MKLMGLGVGEQVRPWRIELHASHEACIPPAVLARGTPGEYGHNDQEYDVSSGPLQLPGIGKHPSQLFFHLCEALARRRPPDRRPRGGERQCGRDVGRHAYQ